MKLQNIEGIITTFPVIDRILDHQKKYTEECLQECAENYNHCSIKLSAIHYNTKEYTDIPQDLIAIKPKSWYEHSISTFHKTNQGLLQRVLYENNVLYGECYITNSWLKDKILWINNSNRSIHDYMMLELKMTGYNDSNGYVTHISNIYSGAIISI